MIARLLSILRSLRAYWLWLAVMREMARTDDAVYAADTRDLALARGGLETLFTHPLASECPIEACRTCESDPPLVIQSEAFHLGRDESEGENIRQVAVWLRHRLSDYWWDAPEGDLQQLAYSLLYLREACEDGKVATR